MRGVLPFCQCWEFLFNAMQIQHSVLPEQSCNLMRKIRNFISLYFFSCYEMTHCLKVIYVSLLCFVVVPKPLLVWGLKLLFKAADWLNL